MVKVKYNHYFITNGCRETGNYSITEVIKGKETILHNIYGNRRGGLKEARQWIGQYVMSKYDYSQDTPVVHQCVKPQREESKNPWHDDWKVNDYLKGTKASRK